CCQWPCSHGCIPCCY
uniref:Conotoxin Asi3a n=1 Tax=Conus asiaticus TaxID=1945508 RepID=M3A_CONAX|nr:RecName: Full=Conotoxin Asi3a [Conus asiaticus]